MGSNRTEVTLTGNLVADPEERATRTGDTFATFRVAVTPRTFSPQDGWQDGQTSFYGVSAFGALAQGVLAQLRKGSPVVVTGELSVREWVGQNGTSRGRDVDVRAEAVGLNLRLAGLRAPSSGPGDRPAAAPLDDADETTPAAYVVAEPVG